MNLIDEALACLKPLAWRAAREACPGAEQSGLFDDQEG